MKLLKRAMCIFCSVMLLTGCGGGSRTVRVEETETLNINEEMEPQAIEGVTLYYDIGNNMGQIVKQKRFKDIAMAVSSVSSEMAVAYNRNSSNDDREKDKKDRDSAEEEDFAIKLYDKSGERPCDTAEYASYVSGATQYSTEKTMLFDNVLESVDPNRLTVMITDLASQIDLDFVSVGDNIAKNILQKDMALAYICVYDYVDNANNRPYFIAVIGNNDAVSDFVSRFKDDRTVSEISNKNDTPYEENTTSTINYEIFANKCGVNGIKYKDIEFVEHGIVYDLAASKEPNSEIATVTDTAGSFTKVNENFNSTNYSNTIEGTVNFDPAISYDKLEADRLVRYMPSKGNKDSKRYSMDDITYLAVTPLVSNNTEDLAGKLKLNIPFNIINGVNLSLLECDVSSEIYSVDIDQKNNGTYRQFTGNTGMTTSIAEGVKDIQGKWRIDDANDSLTFNIVIPDIKKFFDTIDGSTPFVKLNVIFNHYKTKDFLPKWVLDLSSSEKGENVRVTNLQRLFDYIYDYQDEANKAVNGFTLYIKNPYVSYGREANRTREAEAE